MGPNDIEAQGDQSQNGTNAQPAQPLSPTEKRKIHLELYKAALNDKWDIAKKIYEEHHVEYNAEITKWKDTALHIAAAAENFHFVEHLVEKMSEQDLALLNAADDTAFCLVAVSGNVELADVMLSRNKDLAMIRGCNKKLPINMAAQMGRRKMVRHLYDPTNQLELSDKTDLLINLINSDIYDIALEMLEDKTLATAGDKKEVTALHALSLKSSLPKESTHQKLPRLWNKCISMFVASEQTVERSHMRQAALDLIKTICNEVVLLEDDKISRLIRTPWPLIFFAVERGNVEFLTILIRSYPDLISTLGDNHYSIFHIALLHRREKIFKLINEIGTNKDLICQCRDKKGNNMLHLAAQLPKTKSRLYVVPGAALQLQRELLWFEEVKKVVQPQQLEEINNAGSTPDALLIEEHETLIKDGEEWMRETANSCMVVAALIATVVFAASFTIPGGNNQDSGSPIFLRRIAFKVFAVTNALSLFSSVSSVLTFLSILTSRYAMEDFRWSLPNKLVIGLVTLFVSIAAMLVAFITSLFIVLNHGDRMIWFPIPLAMIGCLPVILFVLQHYRLFRDVIKSTYLAKSIFRPNKTPLFSARVGNKKED